MSAVTGHVASMTGFFPKPTTPVQPQGKQQTDPNLGTLFKIRDQSSTGLSKSPKTKSLRNCCSPEEPKET